MQNKLKNTHTAELLVTIHFPQYGKMSKVRFTWPHGHNQRGPVWILRLPRLANAEAAVTQVTKNRYELRLDVPGQQQCFQLRTFSPQDTTAWLRAFYQPNELLPAALLVITQAGRTTTLIHQPQK